VTLTANQMPPLVGSSPQMVNSGAASGIVVPLIQTKTAQKMCGQICARFNALAIPAFSLREVPFVPFGCVS